MVEADTEEDQPVNRGGNLNPHPHQQPGARQRPQAQMPLKRPTPRLPKSSMSSTRNDKPVRDSGVKRKLLARDATFDEAPLGFKQVQSFPTSG